MPVRKKVVKKKVVKRKVVKRKSSFSFKKLFAPFLILIGVAAILSFVILPKTSVLSSQVASDTNRFGQAVTTGGAKVGEANGLSISDMPLNYDQFSLQFFTKVDPSQKADINYIFRKPLYANNSDGGDLLGLYFTGFNSKELIFSSIGGGGVGIVRAPNVLLDNKWHNVRVSYQKGVGSTLFIDGKSLGTVKDSSNYLVNYNNLPVYFGFNRTAQDKNLGNSQLNTSNIMFDEIAIYKGNLSTSTNPTPSTVIVSISKIGQWSLDGTFNNKGTVGLLTPVGKVSFVPSTLASTPTPSPTKSVLPTKNPTPQFASPTPTYMSPSAYPTKTPTPQVTTPTPTKVAMCKAKMSYLRTKTACRPFKSGSTMAMDFGCSDGYVGTRTSTTCTSVSSWTAVAQNECSKRLTPCK